MRKRSSPWIVLLAFVVSHAFLAGCGTDAPRGEAAADVPGYKVEVKSGSQREGYDLGLFIVDIGVDGERELLAIVKDLRSRNPRLDAIEATFYVREGEKLRSTRKAFYFASEGVMKDLAPSVVSESAMDEIFEEGGFYVQPAP